MQNNAQTADNGTENPSAGLDAEWKLLSAAYKVFNACETTYSAANISFGNRERINQLYGEYQNIENEYGEISQMQEGEKKAGLALKNKGSCIRLRTAIRNVAMGEIAAFDDLAKHALGSLTGEKMLDFEKAKDEVEILMGKVEKKYDYEPKREGGAVKEGNPGRWSGFLGKISRRKRTGENEKMEILEAFRRQFDSICDWHGKNQAHSGTQNDFLTIKMLALKGHWDRNRSALSND